MHRLKHHCTWRWSLALSPGSAGQLLTRAPISLPGWLFACLHRVCSVQRVRAFLGARRPPPSACWLLVKRVPTDAMLERRLACAG